MAGYRLVGRLGEGGQGTVFLGRDPAGGSVAVKLLHARFTGDADAQRRFLREIEAARRVARFSTARVLDAGVLDQRPYVVTEYVDGPSLQQLVTEDGPRLGGALESLAVGTVVALTAIHQAGIVHRDFKPANVLLGPDGPRVIDFGIARVLDGTATLTSQAIGTPSYMAPEQLRRGPVGPAADMFAWGVTMVYTATGTPAFGNDTVPAVIGRILRAEPELSGVPEPLRGLVAECLAKDPEVRPTARHVLDRLMSQEAMIAAAGNSRSVMPPPGGAAADTVPVAGLAQTLREPYPGVPIAPGHGGEPPPGTRRRRLPRWTIPVAAVLVASAVSLATVAVARGGGLSAFGGEPKFTKLTSGCGMVPATTIRRWAPQATVQDYGEDGLKDRVQYAATECAWFSDESPGPFRQLRIDVSVDRDVPLVIDSERPKGLDRAKSGQQEELKKYENKANHTENQGDGYVDYYGRLTDLSGIGDEGFVISRREQHIGSRYDGRDVNIYVRWGNADIHVEYLSAETSERTMTPTPDAVAREGAVVVTRDIVRYLSQCTACTR